MFERAYAVSAIGEFKKRILDNMLRLQSETAMNELCVPVGMFLVLDRASGGNTIGDEVIRRFSLLDLESRNIIDFFFLGWGRSKSSSLTFDLKAFQSCRDALHKAGVSGFGGYADLLLFDAWLRHERVSLDFENALHIDLAESVANKRIVSAGSFLEGLLQAAEEIRTDGSLNSRVVIRISDKLGLATAKRSILHFVLEKWGKIIGANSLVELATRRVGPVVDLAGL